VVAWVQPSTATRRTRVRVVGTVQGVGFRPFVYRLANDLGLSGWVLNDTRGVLIEVEGGAAALASFLERLRREAPPLATVERVDAADVAPEGGSGFAIRGSDAGGEAAAPVTPDSTTCSDCLAEMRDPGDRRHRYPFINCTNCGPRFTIVEGVPYDRPLTTMSGFEMCGACRAEYEDPGDRRFHAQPNACPVCGPRARLLDASGAEITPARVQASEVTGSYRPSSSDAWDGGTSADAVEAAAKALDAGRIVAVKGLGGYHLACRADDEAAVTRLRARKHREDKPFAVMVASLEDARALADLGPAEEQALASHERPIVLAPPRSLCRPQGDKVNGEGDESVPSSVAAAVAPGFTEIGLMLAYTPLHHLLLADCGGPLVMTSGNVSDEPIAYRDEEALERLAPIADLFLTHDRPIHIRTDDSVMRSVAIGKRSAPLMLRRSRGFVPAALELPVASARPLLACGAEQKNTFCLAKADRAWVGHHVGDLENYETLRSFREGIDHFERLFAVAPEVCAHDLHPDYLSTKYALERQGVELVGVQHHHAHLAACLAEHGECGPAVGLIFDGTGFGLDGTVWGGEVLVGGLEGFERAGHLLAAPLPGGAAAIREPWRMACAWLRAAAEPGSRLPAALAGAVEPRDWRNCEALIESGLGSPATTSMGRLFDAVGAMCGAPPRVSYEGQAAIVLEAMADPGERGRYKMPLTPAAAGGAASGTGGPGPPGDDWATAAGETDGPAVTADGSGRPAILDPRSTIRAVAADLDAGVAPAVVAARFHNTVAAAAVAAAAEIAAPAGLDTVVLSGGVFQNRRLLESTAAGLAAAGLRVLAPERLPPNDGGISFGQAAIAAARGG
jgi:hydrogenase maturation protein HypF